MTYQDIKLHEYNLTIISQRVAFRANFRANF
jgi:hypothetical protein